MFADIEYRTVNDNIESRKMFFMIRWYSDLIGRKNTEVSKWVRNQNFDRPPFRPTKFAPKIHSDRPCLDRPLNYLIRGYRAFWYISWFLLPLLYIFVYHDTFEKKYSLVYDCWQNFINAPPPRKKSKNLIK